VLRDGGSAEIFIPAFGSRAERTILVDGRSGSKTPGEVYLPGTLPVPGEEGKPVSHAQAEGYFQQLEEVLIAHYGAEKLLNIVLHPIEPGVHMSEKEFVDKLSDPEFDDLLEARYLMQEIIDYRSRHGHAAAKPEK
jgi:hypothetical protein